MPCEVSWLVENRVIYQRPIGAITVEELTAMQEETRRLLDVGSPPIHLITDQTAMTRYPLNLQTLRDTFSFDPYYKQRYGFVLIVTGNVVTRFFSAVLTQLSGVQSRQFATLPEAVEALNMLDASLPPIPVPEFE